VIPYTLERRADTGVSNATLGFWLFLASEVMLFGALFSAYALLRVSAPSWPSGRDVLNPSLGLVNTVVLIAATMAAWRARTAGLKSRGYVFVASGLAIVFLIVKTFEYTSEISAGLTPARSTFAAMYFTLTGVHAAHIVGGLIGNAWAAAGRAGDAMAAARIRLMAVYWAFVDAIWLIIFVLLYL